MAFTNPIIGGNGNLVREQIKSPDYVPGVSGWIIRKDGSVEFNDAVIRGELSAGGGNVTVGASGFHLQGASFQFDINHAAGFLARKNPDNGAQAQMTVIATPTGGGFLGLTPVTPTAANGNDVDFGFVFTDVTVAGADDDPYMWLSAPNINGKPSANILIHSVTSTDQPSVISLDSDRFHLNGVDQGSGFFDLASSPANSAAIGAAETVVLTSNNKTWKAGRAYRCLVNGGVSTSAATSRPLWKLRRTNAAGMLLAFNHGLPTSAIAASNCTVDMQQVFAVGGSDITDVLVLTLQGTAGFNATMTGGNGGRTIEFVEVGPASRYPDAFVLV